MANSVDPDQTAPIGAVCSGSTLFYLQQTTSADDIFRCIFFLGASRVSIHLAEEERVGLQSVNVVFPVHIFFLKNI